MRMKKTLADRLTLLIENLGIKQSDFAQRIQFAQSYVSMVLSGAKTSPSSRFVDAICREFHVNPEWLKNGKGEIYTIPGLPLASGVTEIFVKYQLLSPEKKKVIEDIIDAFLLKSMTVAEEDTKASNKE